jgi:hypothetical protein
MVAQRNRWPRTAVVPDWNVAEQQLPWALGEPATGPRARYRLVVPRALELRSAGYATKTIARELGVPRSTVRYWFGRGAGVAQSAEAIGLKPIQCGFDSHHQHQDSAYAYLLGMYLGDGHLVRSQSTYVLRVFLNEKQGDVIQRVMASISTLLPHNRVSVRVRRNTAVAVVTSYSRAWPTFLPQHGPGRKHTRSLVLESWQREIVARHPGEFLRGLIESDGSRHRRIVGGRDYPAYSFSNRSEDILQMFMWAGGLLGLRPRRASRVAISIARRADVARFDVITGRANVADGTSS